VPVAQVIRVGLPAGERLQPKLQSNMNALRLQSSGMLWHMPQYMSMKIHCTTALKNVVSISATPRTSALLPSCHTIQHVCKCWIH